jgi:hypothetical protein
MSFVKWIYKVATGRTLGKTKELKLREARAKEKEAHADDTVKRSCVAREVAQEQHDEAVSARNRAIKNRKVRVPSSVEITPI